MESQHRRSRGSILFVRPEAKQTQARKSRGMQGESTTFCYCPPLPSTLCLDAGCRRWESHGFVATGLSDAKRGREWREALLRRSPLRTPESRTEAALPSSTTSAYRNIRQYIYIYVYICIYMYIYNIRQICISPQDMDYPSKVDQKLGELGRGRFPAKSSSNGLDLLGLLSEGLGRFAGGMVWTLD